MNRGGLYFSDSNTNSYNKSVLYAGTLIDSGNTKDDKEEEDDEEEETDIDIEALICDPNDIFLPVTADFACTTNIIQHAT